LSAGDIPGEPKALRIEIVLQRLFGFTLLARLLYPFFNSPLDHIFSDPQRHWENAGAFLHPTIMGAQDPFLYQLWLYALRTLSAGSAPTIMLGCGLLCAAMPYGWYRALRELVPRSRAYFGAILIGCLPESISIYAYFMNESLLIALTGFAFWLTLRANRKRTMPAFVLAAAVWLCAAFTRTVAVPMAAACILGLWLTQSGRVPKALVAMALASSLALAAGLHARTKLHFFAPLGNLYFNEIYNRSGNRDIQVDYGLDGRYVFGSPSFYNPTFFPFSDWRTGRRGTMSFSIDLTQGRRDWLEVARHAGEHRDLPRWRQRLEDLVYLFFAPPWPNSTESNLVGWLTLWSRWIWAPVVGVVIWAAVSRRYLGAAWVIPLCGLGSMALLAAQSEGVMEGRFREPIDTILFAALFLIRWRGNGPSLHPPPMLES
jgi:hypothetical protein